MKGARHQASSLQEALEAEGAEALLLPTIELSTNQEVATEVSSCLRELHRYSWIFFTSPNAVEFFFAALREAGLDSRALAPCRIASLGPMTSASLLSRGIHPDFMPSAYHAKAFAEEFIQRASEHEAKPILLPASALAHDDLPRLLQEAGYHCQRLSLYTNTSIHYEQDELRTALTSADYLTACSSSAVHHLVELLETYQLTEILHELPIAVLGEQTAEAVRSYGIEPQLIAPQATISALVDSLVERLR